MENCCYQGKIRCTYDLKDDSGYYYEDQVIEWKEAAALHQLTCVECHAPVYLAAGPIKEPYFAHYDSEACDYGSGTESEEMKKGKRLLYQLLKRSFPEGELQARYRLENGMYSTLFCTDGEHRIALDYRLQNTSLEKFRERDNYYQAKQITVIYILGKRLNKMSVQPDWYQTLIQKSMGYLAFLDTERETLTFRKSISYRLGKERRFRNLEKSFPLREVELDWTGRPIGSFARESAKLANEIEQEKLSYQKTRNQLKAFSEEKRRLEDAEQERLEAYRKRMEQEELGRKKQRQPKDIREKHVLEEHLVGSNASENNISEKLSVKEQLTEMELLELGLNPAIYRKCLELVKEGNVHLVAAKYLEVIIQ